MKKSITLSFLIACLGLAAGAQQFITVPQICPRCIGFGHVVSHLGLEPCPGCCGYGVIQINVLYPNCIDSVAAVNSDGYTQKGTILLKRVNNGVYDSFEFYVKRGVSYVKFNGLYYSLSGQYVIIDKVKYYT